MEQFTKITSFVLKGLTAVPTTVEVSTAPGIGIHIVGLQDQQIRESLLRTVTALEASAIRIPGKKIIINIAPAVLSGDASTLDLPIALGIAIESMGLHVQDIAAAGGLRLDGEVTPVRGTYQFVSSPDLHDLAGALLPKGNVTGLHDSGEFDGEPVHGVLTLQDAISLATGLSARHQEDPGAHQKGFGILLTHCSDALGAATAQTVLGMIPPLRMSALKEINAAASALGLPLTHCNRPARPLARLQDPSLKALFGDHTHVGQLASAHEGVLYVPDADRLPKTTAAALRAPLEDGACTILRLTGKTTYPTRFILVAASESGEPHQSLRDLCRLEIDCTGRTLLSQDHGLQPAERMRIKQLAEELFPYHQTD